MTLADLKCSTCGGPAGERPIVMTRIEGATRITVVRCRKCNTQAATGLGIGTHPAALAKARKRGNKTHADRTRGTRNTLCTRCAEWVDTDHSCAPKRTQAGHLVKQPRETWSDFRLRRDLDRKSRRDAS